MKIMADTNYEDWWEDYGEINRLDPGTRMRKKIVCNEIKKSDYKKILDLGCGSGELIEYIHSKFPEKKLFGADVSKQAINLLKKKGITEQTFICDLEKDKKLVGNYDLIVCSEVIEHLTNWRNVITILRGRVKKGGKVIMTTQSGKRYPHHLEIGHLRHFDPKEIEYELEQAGFEVVSAKKIGWPFMNLKNFLVSHFLKIKTLKQEKLSVIQKLGFNLFYYLYLFSPFPGPQVIVIAKQK